MTLRTLLYAVLVLSLTGCVAYGGGGRHYSPGWGNSGYRYDRDRWEHDYRRDEGRSVIIYQQGHDRNYGSGYRHNPRPDTRNGHRYDSRDGHRDDRHHGESRDQGRDRDNRDRRSQGNSHSVVPREQAGHNRQGQPGYNRQDSRQQVRRQDDRRDHRDSSRYSR